MINVTDLEEYLKDNYDAILSVLLQLGFDEDGIKYRESQHLITSRRPDPDADNPNGVLVYTNSLNVLYTTRSWSGNIFSLVMKIRDVNFPEAIKNIAKWINYSVEDIKIVWPFNGFYRGVYRKTSNFSPILSSYAESELPPPDSLSNKFFLDGVDYLVQESWGIRYDHDNDAVLIPIYDYSGRLVGCKARNNDPNCNYLDRFWAFLPYQKTSVVYGWFQNFSAITEKQTVIVVESEKGVLQAASFDCHIVVGIGGHNISEIQARYIKMLGAKKIIVAFDEGISEEEIKQECGKLEMHNLLKNNVSYIYDKNHIVLPEGSKDSPTDHGKAGLVKLIKQCVHNYRG